MKLKEQKSNIFSNKEVTLFSENKSASKLSGFDILKTNDNIQEKALKLANHILSKTRETNGGYLPKNTVIKSLIFKNSNLI